MLLGRVRRCGGDAPAAAQSDYPRRQITLIVPFAAGGPTDIVSRIVGEHMARTLGQPVIVENIVGAGGTTASTRAMRAQPDGYTIIMGHMGTHAASVALYPNLAYKPDVDFAPIGLAAGTPVLIVARKDFPPKDLKEFVTYVKANADKLNMAHAGVGSVSFTTCLLLNSILGVKPTLVPYNGTGPALTALIAGQVDYMCDQIVNLVQQVKAGQIKAYAIGTDGAATKRCRTCRPARKPACRNSRHRPGTRCSRRRTRRSRSSTSSPTRSTRRCPTTACASACSISAASCRTRASAASNRCRARQERDCALDADHQVAPAR